MTGPHPALRVVRAFAREHALLRPGPLLVAVSGGTDSSALLLVLAALADEHGLVLHVAHFDHRTRPRGAAADAAFVADLAGRCGATLRVGRAAAAPRGEDAARRARYEFLRRVAAELGATAIATGHTRDDQAETVLLHAVRGAGLGGLAAMRPVRDGLIRPLLALGRAETVAICARAGVTPREDPTNRSLAFARNRLRRRVMPELLQLNPRAAEALARLATASAVAVDGLRRSAEQALARAADPTGIELDRLGDEPAVQVEALALAWERATGRALAARSRAALAALGRRRDGSASIDLPGGRAEREYGRLRIVPAGVAAAPRDQGGEASEQKLRPDAVVRWGGWEIALSRRPGDGWAHQAAAPEPFGTLRVRGRRPGDRVGGTARAKLQDVLTDARVPAARRDTLPVIVGATGEVWWVPGVIDRPGDSAWRLVARPVERDGAPG